MKKTAYLLAAAAAIAALTMYLTRPEPTPAERLSDAVQEAGEAAQDAAKELADAAEETVAALQKETEAKADELRSEAAVAMDALSKKVTETSATAQQEMENFISDWRSTGIVTENGIDFDAAVASVNETDLDAETKKQINNLLTFLRDLPGEAAAKLEALEKAL